MDDAHNGIRIVRGRRIPYNPAPRGIPPLMTYNPIAYLAASRTNDTPN